MTRKEIEEPTEVEVELKRRLHQMTDHLIQKQSKVSLSYIQSAIIFLQILKIHCFNSVPTSQSGQSYKAIERIDSLYKIFLGI
jgi:hypothetical protein